MKIDPDGPAFPCTAGQWDTDRYGMSQRTLIAALQMGRYDPSFCPRDNPTARCETLALWAVRDADALLEELNKEPEQAGDG